MECKKSYVVLDSLTAKNVFSLLAEKNAKEKKKRRFTASGLFDFVLKKRVGKTSLELFNDIKDEEIKAYVKSRKRTKPKERGDKNQQAHEK